MDQAISEKVNEIWNELNKDVGCDSELWWNRIKQRYEDHKRKHHTLGRLHQMLNLLNEYRSEIKSPEALAYAMFFRNLSYDPKLSDNEEKSIELFEEFAKDTRIDKGTEIHEKVIELITASKTSITEENKEHETFGSDDVHYFLDIDLSYLGANAEDYSEYSQRIREEFEFMSELMYKCLRVKVLKSLLEIPKIFATSTFYNKYESRARNNIQAEIESIESKLPDG